MARTPHDGGKRRLPSRFLLSLFFVIHFGAVAVYVLPVAPSAYFALPEAVREDVAVGLQEARSRMLYPALVYLSAFSLQQHWQLFAPEPIRWAAGVKVEAWYPTAEGVWVTDTVRPDGYRAAPLPRVGGHRQWRVHMNLGYEGWGPAYGPTYARALCERLRDDRGHRPHGLTLAVEWEPVVSPWEGREPGDTLYVQELGGFDCPSPPRP